jgi:putative Holliday junction resolvase
MRVLAIDHGSARAGCAISDPTGTIARPLGVVEPPDPRAVAELAAEHQAELVIVGLPVSLSGAEGPQAAEARAFRDALAVILDLPVETYDERLTTRLAERSARAGASAPPDALAAAHLLESYLHAHDRASDEVASQAGEAGDLHAPARASDEVAGQAAEPAAPSAPKPGGSAGEAEEPTE